MRNEFADITSNCAWGVSTYRNNNNTSKSLVRLTAGGRCRRPGVCKIAVGVIGDGRGRRTGVAVYHSDNNNNTICDDRTIFFDFHTDSVEFSGRNFADARVRTSDDGGLAVQSGRTRAFSAEHFDRNPIKRVAEMR